MHLTSQVHLGLNHKSHDLADFLAFNSAKLKNSILYHIRQVLTYYQNIKSNKPTYPQQIDVVQKINHSIAQYNSYLKAKYILPDDIDKLNKKLLSPLGLSNYWIDNKTLLQFYAKDLAEYELLSAQSAQQVIDQVIKEFKSFKALIKLYAQKKLSHKPNLPT